MRLFTDRLSSVFFIALVSLFYSAYLPNMPVIHAATFDIEGKSPLLVVAMQACGALYVKTRTAMNFIDTILAKARDELVVELVSFSVLRPAPEAALTLVCVTQARKPVDWEHRVQLALAVDLFQTLGLFHHNPEQRAFSNVYHAVLAMVSLVCSRSLDVHDDELAIDDPSKRLLSQDI